MTRTISICQMIEQLDGLRDTKDVSEWENVFITSVLERYLISGKDTRNLTEKQLDVIERIWNKHYA